MELQGIQHFPLAWHPEGHDIVSGLVINSIQILQFKGFGSCHTGRQKNGYDSPLLLHVANYPVIKLFYLGHSEVGKQSQNLVTTC